MAINKAMGRVGLAGTCLLLLAACAGDPAVERRFEAECKTAGHSEGSEQLAACVEEKWARYRYVPRSGGR